MDDALLWSRRESYALFVPLRATWRVVLRFYDNKKTG